MDPNQDWCSVGPDLGLNCLQRLSADGKSYRLQGKSKILMFERMMRIVVNKHWRVYLVLGHTGSLS